MGCYIDVVGCTNNDDHNGIDRGDCPYCEIDRLTTQLAERDAEIADCNKFNFELQRANTALREEVERLKEHASDYGNALITVRDETRKQAAREILDALTQEEIRRITSVGDPRVTTISSKLLAMMAELRQRYGLEGEG